MVKIKEHPILFSGPMVRAILEGRKSQTRRAVKPQPDEDGICRERHPAHGGFGEWQDTSERIYTCPYGVPGDRLWVRESFAPNYFDNGRPGYMADWTGESADCVPEPRWKPSIHMPRWASRITLEVSGVRVERVQEISEEDAKAEGVVPFEHIGLDQQIAGDHERLRTQLTHPHTVAYASFWDELNFARGLGWKENPWVWIVEFKILKVRQ